MARRSRSPVYLFALVVAIAASSPSARSQGPPDKPGTPIDTPVDISIANPEPLSVSIPIAQFEAKQSDASSGGGNQARAPKVTGGNAKVAGSPIRWFGYVDGAGYAVPGEAWNFDHGSQDPFEGLNIIDVTAPMTPAWRRIDGNVWTGHDNAVSAPVLSEAGSAWVGYFEDLADSLCWTAGLGYGNDWKQRYVSPLLRYDGSGTVALSFKYFNNTETDYDYSRVILSVPGSGTEVVLNEPGFTGTVGAPGTPSTYSRTITELETISGGLPTDFQIVFELASDVAYSDEDGSWVTDSGPFAVDDIRLTNNIVVDATPKIFWSDNGGGWKIRRVKIDGNDRETIFDPADGIANPRGLDLHLATSKVYWVQRDNDGIYHGNLDGSGTVETVRLLSSAADPEGIAIDDNTNSMYWTETRGTAGGGIMRANLDNTAVTQVYSSADPTQIALDVPHQVWYVTDATQGVIIRGTMPGGTAYAMLGSLNSPWGITVDSAGGKVYWTEVGGGGSLLRADLNGANKETLLTGLGTPRQIDIDVATQKLYWVNASTITIQSANLDGSDLSNVCTAGAIAGACYGLALSSVAIPSTAFRLFDFESGDHGFTAGWGGTIGSQAGIADAASYPDLSACSSMSSNILELHDANLEHPIGQHVKIVSPPIDMAQVGLASGNLICETDLFANPLAGHGVAYRIGYEFYPVSCPTTGEDIWSAYGGSTYMASSTTLCGTTRMALQGWLPPGAQQLRLVVEFMADCSAFIPPPGGCVDASDFSPVFDNLRVGFTGDRIRHVPSSLYSTIQAAIDAAAAGDTILLRARTYTGNGNRDLDFGGKNLVLMSEEGATATIIDCQGSEAEPHRGLWFHSGETNAAVVKGITIRNGYVFGANGGGILIEGASPSIIDCILENNTASGPSDWTARGGGICAVGGAPIFSGSEFIGNIASVVFDGELPVYGGGLYVSDADRVEISNCIFRLNQLTGSGGVAPSHGGGAYVGQTASGGQIHISHCEFVENRILTTLVGGQGGGLWLLGGTGAGSVVEFCEFRGNVVDAASGGGAGLYCADLGGGLTFAHCSVTGNILSSPTGVGGAGAFVGLGGAGGDTVQFINVTVSGNVCAGSTASGAGIYVYGADVAVQSGIVHGNCGGRSHASEIAIYGNGATLSLACSNVDSTGVLQLPGGVVTYGSGMLFSDPLFCAPITCGEASAEGDYTLHDDSPCLQTNNDCNVLMGANGSGCSAARSGTIATIKDVPGDQGGWLRLSFNRWLSDVAGVVPYPVTGYWIHQRIDSVAMMGRILAEAEEFSRTGNPDICPDLMLLGELRILEDRAFVVNLAKTPSTMPPGIWEVVGSVPAMQQELYTARVPTLADSTAADTAWSTYVVTAHTTGPSVWFASAPDSGYSIDNIAPAVPQGFGRELGPLLAWQASPDADFNYFSVYGSPVAYLDNGAALLGQTTTTSLDVGSGTYPYYLLTATDIHGNASPAAVLDALSSTPDTMPIRYVLYPCSPNPFNPLTTIRFDLPQATRVRLRIYDLAGRLVRTLVDDELLAGGRREADWRGRDDADHQVGAGVYFYKMEAGAFSETRRMTLLK